MNEEELVLPTSWISDLEISLASAGAGLGEAQGLLEKAHRLSETVISPVKIAKRLYKARRTRSHFFAPGMFGEPAWDLLLDLYVARHEGRSVTTSSACLAGSTSQTTGLRWLKKLADAGLVERRACPDDHRLLYVSLSEEGAARMGNLLRRIAPQFSFSRIAR